MQQGWASGWLLDLPMISLLLFAHLMHSAACVPSGSNYLPTPSPCVAIVGGEVIQVRMFAPGRKPLKIGAWPLQDFQRGRKSRGWVKWIILGVLL